VTQLGHPLFPGTHDVSAPKRVLLKRVSECFVQDFRKGPCSIFLSPHYYFAQDVALGLNNESSSTFYRLYRHDQFGFSAQDSLIDLEFFRQKILEPDFTLPITLTPSSRGVLDGLHRLAIHAAYGHEFVPTRIGGE